MRIVLVAPPWFPVPPPAYGGIELVVAVVAEEFERCGHHVTVVATGDSQPRGTLRAALDSAPANGAIGNAFVEARHALAAYGDMGDADIVHDHSGALGLALASRDASLPPVVHTLHGPWTPEARAFYPLVHDRISLVAISAAQRDDNPDVRYGATIHNGIDIDAYPMNDRPRRDDLVYIGRANHGKNPDGAIRIARASGRPLNLVIKCHEPDEHDYWDHAVAPLLGSDIQVFEDVDHRTKVELLANAYAMVFPIQWPEPFGLVMVEAMACGTPVVARPIGAATELIEHRHCGFLCDSEAAMVESINHVTDLDRNACRQQAIARFSSGRMAADYEHLFTRLLDENNDQRAIGAFTPQYSPHA